MARSTSVTANVPTVIGIDPGSRFTGYGVVHRSGSEFEHIVSGTIKVDLYPLPERLRLIYEKLDKVIATNGVDKLAIESSFLSVNPQTAIKLGQARGVALLAGAIHELEISEYSPREVKNATVGTGKATKEQVQYMVKVILSLQKHPSPDEADALAVAICDLNSSKFTATVSAFRDT